MQHNCIVKLYLDKWFARIAHSTNMSPLVLPPCQRCAADMLHLSRPVNVRLHRWHRAMERRRGCKRAAEGSESASAGTSKSQTQSTDIISPDTSPKISQAEQAGAAVEQVAGSTSADLVKTAILISPFFFWGTSMVAMKELSPHTAPLFVSAVRLLPAGLALIAWAAASGRPQPKSGAAWLAISIFGLADATCFQGFLAEGLQRTAAGLGSVIIDSQPLSVAVLAAIFFGERLTAASVAGLLVGAAGLCLLELPPEALLSLPQTLQGGLQNLTASLSQPGSLWDSGAWWMLLAAQSMAVGTVLMPWVSKFCDPVMATGWHMVLGGLPLAALSAWQEADSLQTRLPQLTGQDLLLLAYISLLGSAASYGVFFDNASRGNLTALSSLTFLTPMFAAGTGYLVLHETLTPLQATGAAVTLGAVALINQRPKED